MDYRFAGCRSLCSAATFSLVLVAATALFSFSAHGATFTIINADGPGEGFNDTTPAAPVGGNSGTTIGEQRQIAFQYAADLLGALIASPVVIEVSAKFDPLACNANSGVLGSAGPTTVFRDYPSAPMANTWYVQATANSHAGIDLDPANPDLTATFNSQAGTPGCLQNSGFYLGLDASPTGSLIDFVSVLAHELSHGAGFLSLVDIDTGAMLLDRPDAYVRCLEDHSAGLAWVDLDDAGRLSSVTDTNDLHWICSNAVSLGGMTLSSGIGAGGHVEMYAPRPVERGSSVSHYSKSLFPNALMEPAYTGPNHDQNLTVALFKDVGWAMEIVDCTGVSDGTPCDDGLLCTGIDLCAGGVCSGGPIPGCTTTTTTTTTTTSTTTSTTTTSTTTTSTTTTSTTTTSTTTTSTTTTTLPPPTTTTTSLPPTTLPSTTTTTVTTGSTTTSTLPVGVCGDPAAPFTLGLDDRNGRLITASDALFVLSAAVGTSVCELCLCDANDSGAITATDALAVLNAAVGLPIELVCPPCP